MEKNLQTNEITLQVNGQQKTFSEKELRDILEEHFNSTNQKAEETNVAGRPTDGYWFNVSLDTIKPELFKETRLDQEQDWARVIILAALNEAKYVPKYARPFKTMIPIKTWRQGLSTEELIRLASKLGDHNADWVEWALELAQRISNGETWEDICNKPDTAGYARMIIWQDGTGRIVGGARKGCHNMHKGYPPFHVYQFEYSSYHASDAVPLVVAYD